MEHLEQRQLLAAGPALTLVNLDKVPGNERMVFNRVGHLDAKVPNVVHDKAKLRLQNTGGATLSIKSLKFSGPWKIVGTAPTSIAAGKFSDITIQFTANVVLPYTFNQTNGTTNVRGGSVYTGSLTIATNDTARPSQVEQLAGWYQDKSENSEEASLQTILNLVFNYKTNISSTRNSILSESTGKKLYGEEVNSAYWSLADTTKSVYIRQIAAFHTQGTPTVLKWFNKGSSASTYLFTTEGKEGQAFLPHMQGSTAIAEKSFKPASTTAKFGFKIDNEYTDDKLNSPTGGGHHVRFYPVRDHNGKVLANTYFMCLDYSNAGSQNYDFQDAVYVVGNIKPMGN